MKKTLLSLIFVAAITGCSIIPKSPYQQSAVVLDYSEYTNKGFFMTEAILSILNIKLLVVYPQKFKVVMRL